VTMSFSTGQSFVIVVGRRVVVVDRCEWLPVDRRRAVRPKHG
jgi:hypothetical protein